MKAAFDVLTIRLRTGLLNVLPTIGGAVSPVTIQSRRSERVQPSGGGVWVGREKKGERRKTGKADRTETGEDGGYIIFFYLVKVA